MDMVPEDMMLMNGGGAAPVDVQDTPLVLTCTTTGAATLTLSGMTVATSKTVVVDWGDGNTNTYTAGGGARTYAYAGAGTYAVKVYSPGNITALDLRDTKLSGTINAANPLPNALISLIFVGLTGVTCVIDATAPIPTTIGQLYILTSPNISLNPNQVSRINRVMDIRIENSLSAAAIDALLAAFWNNKANFIFSTPLLDLLGGSNAAPNGTYQAATPPTTGKEFAYALVNTAPGYNWVVQTA